MWSQSALGEARGCWSSCWACVRQQMVTISKHQAQVRIQASLHADVDFHYRNGTCIRHLTNDMLLFCYYLCSRHSDPIMTNRGVTLARDLNTLINKSVLTVDSDLLWCLWWYSSTSRCWCGTRWHGCYTCRLQRTEKGGGVLDPLTSGSPDTLCHDHWQAIYFRTSCAEKTSVNQPNGVSPPNY